MARKTDKTDFEKKREQIARLSRNEDFKDFLRWFLDDFCVFDGISAPLEPFIQGVRAAAGRVKNCLCQTKEGAELVAEIAGDFFRARGRVAEAERAKKTKEMQEL